MISQHQPQASSKSPRFDPQGRISRRSSSAHPRSSSFIVTEDTFGPLAESNPDAARTRIVNRLHETCSLRILAFLRKSVPVDVAEELTQETFLRLLQVENLEKKSISISYLFRVAQNLLRRRYNLATRFQSVREDYLHHEIDLFTTTQDNVQCLAAIEAETLGTAMEGLRPHEKETVRLIVCEGMTYAEAARIMSVPISTVNNWKHRAIRKLRGFINAAHGSKQHGREPRIDAIDGGDPSGGDHQQGTGAQEAHEARGRLQGTRRGAFKGYPARAAG